MGVVTIMTDDDLIGKKSPEPVEDSSTSQEQTKSKKKRTKQSEELQEVTKRKGYLRKYTGNGTLPLHECAVLSGQPTFICLATANGRKPQYFKYVETCNKDLYPSDTINTQNPLPYIFSSTEEFKEYLDLAGKESFETLYSKVESIVRKYVNAEEHYIIILSADIIYSYFQDKFPTTHYNIIIGDNGSGKNSALLVFRHLGYRVFYVVSASAANYFTFLTDIEEGQGSIAEDEAEGIGYDIEKQKVVKTGYCSGGTVPKVDLSQGRTQDSWLTYCHKWYAMEELPDYKKIKGILDRSFVYNFVVGNVQYNIKDVIKDSGDPEFKSLHDELTHTRKLLFAFRMLHYDDIIPNVKLNIIHRNEELTKPLLRLFSYRNDCPIALDKIRLALSKFILGRNESKKNSIESKLLEAINNLVAIREKYKDAEEFKGLAEYAFYNEHIRAELRSLMEGKDIPGKSESFYSPEYGAITHKRITGLYKSKLKAESFIARSPTMTKRGLKFTKEVLDKLTLYYNVPNEIKIVTDVTDVTHSGGIQEPNNDVLDGQDMSDNVQYASDINENNDLNDPLTRPKSVTTVTSVTDEKWNNSLTHPESVTTDTSVTDDNTPAPSKSVASVVTVAEEQSTYTCSHCNNVTFNEAEHWKHTVNKHPGRTGYPIMRADRMTICIDSLFCPNLMEHIQQ